MPHNLVTGSMTKARDKVRAEMILVKKSSKKLTITKEIEVKDVS